jgi:hypothetical protein
MNCLWLPREITRKADIQGDTLKAKNPVAATPVAARAY